MSEDRTGGSFDRVEIRNGIQLRLTVGPTTSVQLSAQQNILPLVSTTVSGGKLTAQTTQSVISTAPIAVTVTTPSLVALSMFAGAVADVNGVAAEAFALEADSGAHAKLVGTVDTFTLTARNGALLELNDFVARDITLAASSGVTGTIHATGTVSGTASDGVALSVSGGATLNVSTGGGAIITSN
jgi:hypothetical protein